MTILSRTAQLIRDLREMRVITDEDRYSYASIGEGKVKLTINLSTRMAGVREDVMSTIQNAIQAEFSKESIEENETYSWGLVEAILQELQDQ